MIEIMTLDDFDHLNICKTNVYGMGNSNKVTFLLPEKIIFLPT